jgi:hypothetical protein
LRIWNSHIKLLTVPAQVQARLPKGGPAAGNREEENRALGMPRGQDSYARKDEEQQHVLGLPVDWCGPVDRVWLRSLVHPIKGYKRWTQRRRLGPYAPDQAKPDAKG